MVSNTSRSGIPEIDAALSARSCRSCFFEFAFKAGMIAATAEADAELQRAHIEALLLGVSEKDLHGFVSKHYPHWGVKPLG